MNPRALENLVRLSLNGSFTQVAETAHVTLSTLSMQMKSLEAELGVALFDRSHRPPRLTPLGRSIAHQAHRVVEAQSELKELCQPLDGLNGHFRMGFTGSASLQILPRFLTFSQRQWPQSSFEFIGGLSETLYQQVRADVLDAAVVTQVPGAMGGVHVAPIRAEPMVLVYPAAHGRTYMPADRSANGLPFLHFQPRSGIGVLISGFLAELGISPMQSIQMDSIDAIVECVALGAGFSLLPELSVTRSDRTDVQVQDLPEGRFDRQVVLITPDHSKADRWRDLMHAAVIDATRM